MMGIYMSISFNIRCIQTKNPFLSFTIFTVLIQTQLAYVLYYVEGHFPSSKIQSFLDSTWYIFITITTVGYGDEVPISIIGRFVGVTAAVIGVAVTYGVVIFMEDCFQNKNLEGKAFEFLERGKIRKRLHHVTSNYMLANLRFLHAKNKYKRDIANVEKNMWGDLKREKMREDLKLVYSDIFRTKKIFKFELCNFRLVYDTLLLSDKINEKLVSILSHLLKINEKNSQMLRQLRVIKYKREKEFSALQSNKLIKEYKIADTSIRSEDNNESISVNKNEILNYINEMINHNNEFKFDDELREFIDDDEDLEEVQKHFKKPKKKRYEESKDSIQNTSNLSNSNDVYKVSNKNIPNAMNKSSNKDLLNKSNKIDIIDIKKIIELPKDENHRHYSLFPIEDTSDTEMIRKKKKVNPRKSKLILTEFLADDEEDKK